MEDGGFPKRLPMTSEVSFISSVTSGTQRHPDWFPEEGAGAAAASGRQSMVLKLTDDNPPDVFLITNFS